METTFTRLVNTHQLQYHKYKQTKPVKTTPIYLSLQIPQQATLIHFIKFNYYYKQNKYNSTQQINKSQLKKTDSQTALQQTTHQGKKIDKKVFENRSRKRRFNKIRLSEYESQTILKFVFKLKLVTIFVVFQEICIVDQEIELKIIKNPHKQQPFLFLRTGMCPQTVFFEYNIFNKNVEIQSSLIYQKKRCNVDISRKY
eukprot:TRINITY_DN2950_c0_g1_i7.p1 TRINITY_DN2950_c0_g1~~TRINITY_DN2950_c0_g1_i7.p1  ORF type:complete len:199 (+),score=0.25 TRINITY_DN2950_c0_g1_i7:110-706(+)